MILALTPAPGPNKQEIKSENTFRKWNRRQEYIKIISIVLLLYKLIIGAGEIIQRTRV